MAICTRNAQLTQRVQQLLTRLIDLLNEASQAVGAGDQAHADKIDQDIEHGLGEKERAIGALRQHRDEHGC